MHISQFLIVVGILVDLVLLRPASAYLIKVSAWEKEETGQQVFLGGDSHQFLTAEDNLDQLEDFQRSVLSVLNSRLQVLVEAKWLYFLHGGKLDRESIDFHFPAPGRLVCGYETGSALNWTNFDIAGSQNSWLLQKKFYEILAENPSIVFRSVDPRAMFDFWGLNAIAKLNLRDLFQLGWSATGLLDYLSSEKFRDAPLRILIEKQFLASMKSRQEQLVQILGDRVRENPALWGVSNEELLEQGWVSLEALQRLGLALGDPRESLRYLSVELEALFEIAKPEAESQIFLLMGVAHSYKLESFLPSLGYRRVFSTREDLAAYALQVGLGRILSSKKLDHAIKAEVHGGLFDVGKLIQSRN